MLKTRGMQYRYSALPLTHIASYRQTDLKTRLHVSVGICEGRSSYSMVASCIYPYDDMILRSVLVRKQCLPDVPKTKFPASLSRSSRNKASESCSWCSCWRPACSQNILLNKQHQFAVCHSSVFHYYFLALIGVDPIMYISGLVP